jgi:hypothetical protein
MLLLVGGHEDEGCDMIAESGKDCEMVGLGSDAGVYLRGPFDLTVLV